MAAISFGKIKEIAAPIAAATGTGVLGTLIGTNQIKGSTGGGSSKQLTPQQIAERAALEQNLKDRGGINPYVTAQNVAANTVKLTNLAAPKVQGGAAAPTLFKEGPAQVAGLKNITQNQINDIVNPLKSFQVAAPNQINAAQIAAQQARDNSVYTPQQAALLQQLQLQASGRGGPSPAEMILARQNQQNTAQAMALAASQSGRGLPVAQRQIMQQAALGGQDAAQQAAILRAQEMLQSQGLAAQALQGARQSDLDLAMYNAGQGNDIAQIQAQLGLQAQQSNVQNQLATENIRAQVAQAAAQAGVQLTEAQLDAAVRDRAANLQSASDTFRTKTGAEQALFQTASDYRTNQDKLKADIYNMQQQAALQQYQTDTQSALAQRGQDININLETRQQDINRLMAEAGLLMNAEQQREAARNQKTANEMNTYANIGIAGLGAAAKAGA